MVNVDIDPLIYNNLKKIVSSDRISYPSVKFLVQKLLMDNMEKKKDL